METISHLKQGATLHNDTYRILKVLGQGGFGITYLAKHVRLKKQVAIKEFFPKTLCGRDTDTSRVSAATDANVQMMDRLRRKFLKEAEHIAAMDHPNIVRITDVFEENGTAYYVMDYIEGRPLSQIVDKANPLTEQKALRYITLIGDALSYIHSKRMNHLDVKPANIIVREKDDTPILIDFGLSKQYDSDGSQTTTTPVGFTHGYAPMEQYNDGGVKNFSPQTDVYSLGATLYYLLSGVVPPHATTLNEEELTFPQGVPARLIAPISKAMSLARKDRYPDVDTFIRVLKPSDKEDDDTQLIGIGAVDGSSDEETSTGASSGGRHNRFLKPKIKWIIVLTAAVVAIGAGLLVWFNTIEEAEISEPDGYISDHGYVDLGLPSGLKWATTNVGASTPSDYGNYYAWGETATKSSYTEDNSLTYGKSISELRSAGIIGTSGTLTMSHDAARANWSGSWRMPTRKECEELKDKCTWTWTRQGGLYGYKVTGPNGRSIFLPAAGWRLGTSLNGADEYGYYWSSTPSEENAYGAYRLDFGSGSRGVDWSYRYFGGSVRPVSE